MADLVQGAEFKTMTGLDLLVVQYAGISGKSTLSPPCAKVHMALRFKGLDYKTYNCKSPSDVKEFNSRGRVPSLKIGDEVIVDSSDILTELDRRWPQPPLLPEDPILRAQCKMLEDWADEVLYFYGVYLRWVTPDGFAWMRQAAFGKLPWPLRTFVPFLVRRQAVARVVGQGTGLKPRDVVLREFKDCILMLSGLLGEKQFFCGNQLTRADLSLAAVIDQSQIPSLPADLFVDLTSQPNLQAWLDRVHQLAPSAAG